MTNEQRAHKQAAKVSKTEGSQFVVYVFDEGYAVYGADQARIYAPLILIEACYIGGVQVSQQVAA